MGKINIRCSYFKKKNCDRLRRFKGHFSLLEVKCLSCRTKVKPKQECITTNP